MQNYHFRSDSDFLAAVENHEIEGGAFDHKAHIRLACIYFWTLGFEAGKSKTADTIKHYAEALGASDKFHATVTYAYFRLVAETLVDNPDIREWRTAHDVFFAQENSLNHKSLESYYSDFLLSTEEAKRRILQPDRKTFHSDDRFNITNFEWIEGRQPIIVSMPHNGTCVPEAIAKQMTGKALRVEDTDWFLRLLYDFVIEKGCYVINPVNSRYVIDLNRSSDGQALYPGANNTELCPTTMFDLEPIYQNNNVPDESEINRRIEHYWKPYHRQLEEGVSALKSKFGKVLLFEAHSIASRVPRFFEGQLPDFNFGTNEGMSCSDKLSQIVNEFDTGPYSKVVNGRFKGGFITRHYADTNQGVSTIQLELSQATYMDEETLAYNATKVAAVRPVLNSLMESLTSAL